MTDSIPEQLAYLRKTTEPHHLRRANAGCLSATVVIVAGFLLASYFLIDWRFILPAVIFGAIGLGTSREFAKHMSSHLTNVRLALDYYESLPGTVRVTVEVDDSSNVYRAGVRDRAGNDWTFPFLPVGWNPTAGDYPAELRYVENVAWPVLIVTDTGILYPRYDPKQERLALPEEEGGSSSPKGRIFLGVLMIAAAIGWSSIMWNMYRLDARIIESGVTVEAEVLRVGHLRAKPGENSGLVYRLTLPDGRVIERTWSEEEGRWKSYRVGDRILVRYHPDDPNRHLVENHVGTSLSLALLFIAIGGLTFSGFGVALLVSGK